MHFEREASSVGEKVGTQEIWMWVEQCSEGVIMKLDERVEKILESSSTH